MISPADALYGAAYQVLFERVFPDQCTTYDRYEAISRDLDAVSEWIKTQSSDIEIAYSRAAKDILKRASDVLENNERARQMVDARSTLPTPPVRS